MKIPRFSCSFLERGTVTVQLWQQSVVHWRDRWWPQLGLSLTFRNAFAASRSELLLPTNVLAPWFEVVPWLLNVKLRGNHVVHSALLEFRILWCELWLLHCLLLVVKTVGYLRNMDPHTFGVHSRERGSYVRKIFVLLAEHLRPFVDGVLTKYEVLRRWVLSVDFRWILRIGVAQWFGKLDSVLVC